MERRSKMSVKKRGKPAKKAARNSVTPAVEKHFWRCMSCTRLQQQGISPLACHDVFAANLPGAQLGQDSLQQALSLLHQRCWYVQAASQPVLAEQSGLLQT